MTTYHHGDLRAVLLAAAAKIIEKEGLAGLSVREAARRAGVSHNAPYRHFPDRDALLAALAANSFELLRRATQDQSGRELGVAYVRFALEHPGRFRLMFGARLPVDHHRELRLRVEEVFAGLGADAEIAAAAAWSLVHGLARLLLDGHLEGDEAFVRKVLGAVRFAVQRSA